MSASALSAVLMLMLTTTIGPVSAEGTPADKTEATQADKPALFKPDWDQAANIKDAAERLGKLHRVKGPKAAIQFIDACYRTNGLAEAYTERFEACIAQDYMETQVLAQVYSRLPEEQLKQMGAPTAQGLADGLGKRVVAAFQQYKISAEYAGNFKQLVDTHGFPTFIPLVFPKGDKSDGKDATNPSEQQPKPKQR
jgi:hypothetical protein